jgi:hypothetical protein
MLNVDYCAPSLRCMLRKRSPSNTRTWTTVYCTVSTRLINVGLGELNDADKTYLDTEQLYTHTLLTFQELRCFHQKTFKPDNFFAEVMPIISRIANSLPLTCATLKIMV